MTREARPLTALRARAARPLATAAAIRRLHDDALHHRAFARTAAERDTADRVLGGIGARVRRLPAHERRQLDDHGVDGSATSNTVAWPIAAWLAARFPREAEIDWGAIADHERLDALLRTLLLRAEEDEFDSGTVGTREWLRAAEGASAPGDLAWIAAQVRDRRSGLREWAALWDALEVPVRWRLAGSGGAAARTRLQRPAMPAVRPAPMRHAPARPAAFVATPLPGIRRLGSGDARHVIDTARAALTCRAREVHAITFASEDEVWWADLGAGVALAVIGVEPEWRLPLEANYGWMAFSLGVPIAYGGVSPLDAQANTGIHLFEPFRGSEAAYLWAACLRAFATLFGVRRFVVNPVQVGDDNEEAIASGAFWFYWRLGFRPVKRELRAAAAREFRRLRSGAGRRTAPGTLRRLAAADLHLVLAGAGPAFDEAWLRGAAHAVTARLAAAAAGGNRRRAVLEMRHEVARALGAPGRLTWSDAEVHAFGRLAPVVSVVLGEVKRWPARERRALLLLMRAKGSPRELAYVRAMRRVPKFWAALARTSRATSASPSRRSGRAARSAS